MLKDNQIKILMLVHELEKNLADMYVLFAEKFPEYGKLWDILIREENEHAEAVRTLYQLSYKGQSTFDEGNIKPAGVQSIIDYLKSTCEKVRYGRYTAEQILVLAHDIENSLIEKNIFSQFKVSLQYSPMLRKLHEGSLNHALLAKKELEIIKKKS